MARRKAAADSQIPEISPSKARTQLTPEKPLIQIDEDEQWRIIKQTGILDAPELQDTQLEDTTEEDELPLGEEIFQAVLLIIPFSSLLLLMEILIHHQYGKVASLDILAERMLPGVPILSLFIFYTTRYKSHRRMQIFLFGLACLTGSRLIYQYNNASWLVNMKQCPPLITVWIYTILQLDLGPSVMSLFAVAIFVWWKGLKIK